LPDELREGYVMNIGNLRNEFTDVKIEKSQYLAALPIGLSVSCRGKAYLFQPIQVDTTNCFELNIPKKELPSGVNQITLFNTNGEVLSERLFFVNHPDEKQLSFQVTPSSQSYQPYQPIDLKFQIRDPKGLPVETDFSLAVRDEDTEDNTGDVGSIMSNLLLSSDLKGYIETPSKYFNKDDSQRIQKLDLLMMIQGWRRYSWREEAGISLFELKRPVEKGLLIEGFVVTSIERDFSSYQKERNMEVFAEIKCDSLTFHDSCRTDENGRFRFVLNDFHGKVDLKLQVKQDMRKKTIFIPLKRVFPPKSRAYSYYETALSDDLQPKHFDTITSMGVIKGRQLREVTVKARKKTRYRFNYSIPNLCLNYQNQIDFQIDNGEYYMMLNTLNIPSILINLLRRGLIGGDISLRLNNYDLFKSSFSESGSLSPERIESILIYVDQESRKYSTEFESDIPESLVSFNTYGNEYSRQANESGLRFTTMQGFSFSKDFYSPSYVNKLLPDTKDFRRTLYWNPDVCTDSSGSATVHFYNNSNCKSIKICAETVTKTGEIGVLVSPTN